MAGLLSIAPLTETVHGVTVTGVSLAGVAHLLAKFPELRMLMAGKEVDANDLITLAPQAVAEIIAAGVGFPGDGEQVEHAQTLSLELQADFLEAILRLTMPKGVGPFVEKITKLGAVFGGVQSQQDTNTPKQPKR